MNVLPSPDDVEYFRELARLPASEIGQLSNASRQVLELANSGCDKWIQIHDVCELLGIADRAQMNKAIVPLIGGGAVLFAVKSEPESGDCDPDPLGHVARYVDEGSLRWFHKDGNPCECTNESRIEVFPMAALKITARGMAMLNAKQAGQTGHSKNNSPPPDDVAAVMRLMKLKRWQDKNPIDVCRHYVSKNIVGLPDDEAETAATNLKRKVNRHRKK